MEQSLDSFWQAAAAHVEGLEAAPHLVFAPSGFEGVLPGCRIADDACRAADCAALVLHKGRLGDVPPQLLIAASADMIPSFANEVFIVLSRSGTPLAPENNHGMDRADLLAAALLARAEAAKNPVSSAGNARMPAAYMGQGRVLLETSFGHLMLVNGADTAIVPHLVRDGWFDRTLTDMIGHLLRPGMTFIDIGANFGTYTLIGAQKVGAEGRVIAVEPAPGIATLLSESVTLNGFAGRTAVLRCAVGEEEGTLTLHEFATRQGSNTMLAHVAEAARSAYDETITARQVPCRTLDAITAQHGLERVDLIKIDVEGFEHQVLKGARATLARHRPQLILEWHRDFFTGRMEAARALFALLTEELGYRLEVIEPGASTRAAGFEELMAQDHSDLLARYDGPGTI